jgi:hypothetical protein
MREKEIAHFRRLGSTSQQLEQEGCSKMAA